MIKHSPLTLRDPLGSEEQEWHGDLLMPSFFLVAAVFILGVINPIHLAYAPQPVVSLVAVTLIGLIVVWGVVRKRGRIALAGSGLLLLLAALFLLTQPYRLGVSLADVWPLRTLLFGLIAGSWLFLLKPPLWARRALIAAFLTVVPPVLCSVVPMALAQLAPIKPIPPPPFLPYWLTTDSQNRLYATASGGGYIWTFSNEGVPLGVIYPHLAPDIGTTERGFRPIGFPSPTPQLQVINSQSGQFVQPVRPPFTFCGIAIGSSDKLYIVDPSTLQLLRLRTDGTVEKRLRLPDDFQGARGCLAADSTNLYLGSRYGIVYILDLEGQIKREIEVKYQPFGIATDGKGTLFVLAPDHIDRFDLSTGEVTELPYPQPVPGEARAPYQALALTSDGDILVSDLPNARVLRISGEDGSLVGTVGETGSVASGFLPGKFAGPGGITLDSMGRIYIADWQLGAVQRFTPDGSLDEVFTAPGDMQVLNTGEENE